MVFTPQGLPSAKILVLFQQENYDFIGFIYFPFYELISTIVENSLDKLIDYERNRLLSVTGSIFVITGHQ
jgi:hypothetical protein